MGQFSRKKTLFLIKFHKIYLSYDSVISQKILPKLLSIKNKFIFLLKETFFSPFAVIWNFLIKMDLSTSASLHHFSINFFFQKLCVSFTRHFLSKFFVLKPWKIYESDKLWL